MSKREPIDRAAWMVRLGAGALTGLAVLGGASAGGPVEGSAPAAPATPATTTDPKPDPAGSPKSDSKSDSKSEAKSEPKSPAGTAATSAPDPKPATGSPAPSGATAGMSGATGTTGASTDPATPAADPKSAPAADPKTGTSPDPKTPATGDPGATQKTDPGTTPKTDPGTTPKTAPAADPKTGTSPDPKTPATGDPKAEPKTDPGTTPKSDPPTRGGGRNPYLGGGTSGPGTGGPASGGPRFGPGSGAGSDPGAAPSGGTVSGDGKIRFAFKEMEINGLLAFLERAAGVKVYSNGLVLPPLRIALATDRPVTLDETLDTINAVLQTVQPVGFTIVDDRPRFITVVPLTLVKQADIPLLAKDVAGKDLKPVSRVVRATFSCKGDDSAALAVSLRSMVSPWGELISNKADNSITVVDTEKRVKNLREMLDRILPAPAAVTTPVEEPGSDLKSYTLRHVDPEEGAVIVRQVVGAGSAFAGTGGRNPYASPALDGRGPPGEGRRDREGGSGSSSAPATSAPAAVSFTVVANFRSRQLLVRGTTLQHALVKEVLDRIDVAPVGREDTEIVRVISLAGDPELVAENLREVFREGERGGTSSTRSRFGSFGGGGFSRDGGGPPREGGGPPSSGSSAENVVRYTIRITPNREQRCLVVSGLPADVERAEKLAKEIDGQPNSDPHAVVTRTFKVRHGSAEQIARKLNQVFEGRPETATDASRSSDPRSGYSSSSGYDWRSSRSSSGGDNPYLVRTEGGSSGSSSSSSSSSERSSDRYSDWRSSFADRSSSRRSTGYGRPAANGPRVAIAENRLNMIIISAPQTEFVQIEALLLALDQGGEVEALPVPTGRSAEAVAKQALEIYKVLHGKDAKDGKGDGAPAGR